MSLHIVDIIALVVTRLAHIHPLFTVHFNVMGLEIVFIGAPGGLEFNTFNVPQISLW